MIKRTVTQGKKTELGTTLVEQGSDNRVFFARLFALESHVARAKDMALEITFKYAASRVLSIFVPFFGSSSPLSIAILSSALTHLILKSRSMQNAPSGTTVTEEAFCAGIQHSIGSLVSPTIGAQAAKLNIPACQLLLAQFTNMTVRYGVFSLRNTDFRRQAADKNQELLQIKAREVTSEPGQAEGEWLQVASAATLELYREEDWVRADEPTAKPAQDEDWAQDEGGLGKAHLEADSSQDEKVASDSDQEADVWAEPQVGETFRM